MPRSKQSRAKKAKTVALSFVPQPRSADKLPNEVLESLLHFIPENRHVAKQNTLLIACYLVRSTVNSVNKFGAVRCDRLWHLRFVSRRWLSVVQRICSKFELHVEVRLGEKVELAKAAVHYCIGGVILPPKPLRDVVQCPIRMPGLHAVNLSINFSEQHDFHFFPDWFIGAMRYLYESIVEVYVDCNNTLPLLCLAISYMRGSKPAADDPLHLVEEVDSAELSKLMNELPWNVHSLDMSACQSWMSYRIEGFTGVIHALFQAVATNLKALDIRFDVLSGATPPGAVFPQTNSLTLHSRPLLAANESVVDGLSRALERLPALFPNLSQLEFVNLLLYSSAGANLEPLLAMSALKALCFSKSRMDDLWHAAPDRKFDIEHPSIASLRAYVRGRSCDTDHVDDAAKLVRVSRRLERLELFQGDKQLLRDFVVIAGHQDVNLSRLQVLRLEMLPQICEGLRDNLFPFLQVLPVGAPLLTELSLRITDFDGRSALGQDDLETVLPRLPTGLRRFEMSGMFPDEQLMQDWQHGPETRRGARIGVNYEADAKEMLRVLAVVVANAPQLTSFAWLDAFCANTGRWTVPECEKLSAIINKEIKRASKRKNANFKSLRTFVNYVDKAVLFYVENTTSGNRQKLSFGVSVGYRF